MNSVLFCILFMRWSVRYSHKRRQRRGSGRQFIALRGPKGQEAGLTMQGHMVKQQAQEAEDSNEEVLTPWPLLRFPWERQGRAG